MPKRYNYRKADVTGGQIVLGVFVVAMVVAALIALGGLITMLVWNLGVVAIIAACGGSVGKISFVVAILVNVALSMISGVIRGRPSNS